MHRVVAAILFLLLIFAPFGVAGPVGGGLASQEKIGPQGYKDTRKFRAGERAVALVANKSKFPSHFHISVFDAKGNLVTEAKNKAPSKEDLVAAFWYPPREAEYRIEIKNLETSVNDCFVTIK